MLVSEKLFSLIELMLDFAEGTSGAPQSITSQGEEVNLSDLIQNFSDGTVHYLLKCATSEDILLKSLFFLS